MSRAAWLVQPHGPVDYDVANDSMHALADRRLAGAIPDSVILLEHPPVFTAGRRAKPEELLWEEAAVHARGGLVRRIDRGGSFTFHGPGQLVAYPIVGLSARGLLVRPLVRALEAALVTTCATYGVAAARREGQGDCDVD